MNYGLIGCGKISENHIKAALDNNFNISFISDIKDEKMNELIKKFQLADTKKYIDYHDFDLDDVDFVSIATPSGNHFKDATFFLNHDINVLIEKPIALSLNDIHSLIQLKNKNTALKASVIYPLRYSPSIQKAKYIIQNKLLGELTYSTLRVIINRNKEYYNHARWRGTWAGDGGGVLMNQAIHHIDLIQWFNDSPVKKVFSHIDNFNHPYIETEDFVSALMTFNNNKISIIEITSASPNQNFEETILLFFEKGIVRLSGKSLVDFEIVNSKEELNIPHDSNSVNYSNLHSYSFSKFSHSIIKNTIPDVTLEESKKAIEIIFSIYLSSLNNKEIDLPLIDLDSLYFKDKFHFSK